MTYGAAVFDVNHRSLITCPNEQDVKPTTLRLRPDLYETFIKHFWGSLVQRWRRRHRLTSWERGGFLYFLYQSLASGPTQEKTNDFLCWDFLKSFFFFLGLNVQPAPGNLIPRRPGLYVYEFLIKSSYFLSTPQNGSEASQHFFFFLNWILDD